MIGNAAGDAKPMLVNYAQGLLDISTASQKHSAHCGTIVMIAQKEAEMDFWLTMLENP